MKKFKVVLSLIMVIVITLSSGVFCATVANGTGTDGYYTYSMTDGEVTITRTSSSAEGSLVIPSTLGGGTVIAIGDDAVRNCTNVTEITIPSSVTTIGTNAFWSLTNVESITFEEGSQLKTIGSGAFYNCTGLKSIVLPEKVESICDDAFEQCTKLESITFADNCELLTIGRYAFNGCTSLSKIDLPGKLETIGYRAFSGCTKFTSLVIPDSVTTIGTYAFSGCSYLTNITMGSGVKTVGESAFNSCSQLMKCNYSGTIAQWCEISFSDVYSSNPMYFTKGLYIDGKKVTAITKENSAGATYVGDYAFCNFKNLTELELADTVTTIGKYAFDGCTALESIILPESLTSIGSYAFYDCSKLKKFEFKGTVAQWCSVEFADAYANPTYYYDGITINGENITQINESDLSDISTINNYAFYNCSDLTKVVVPDNITSIGSQTFYNCNPVIFCNTGSYGYAYALNNSRTYYLMDDEENRYITGTVGTTISWTIDKETQTLTIDCDGIMPSFSSTTAPWKNYTAYFFNVVINEGCTKVGQYAFSDCKRITSVTLPDSITGIESYAFSGCYNLETINIPDSVITIADNAFRNCLSLENVTLPDGLTSIGNYAFYGCSSLESIVISDGITSIGKYTFEDCTSLKSVILPNNLLKIDGSAFNGCSSLSNVIIPPTVTSIGSDAFENCSSLTEMYLPLSVKTVSSGAFYGCKNLAKLTIYNRNCTLGSCAESYTTIYGFAGSTAEAYAEKSSLTFVSIDDTHVHTYDGDCGEYCTVCGYDRGEVHTYGDWIVSKEATCTEVGEKYKQCSTCSAIVTEEIAATGHDWDTENYDITVAPTCTEDGTITYHCKNCDETSTASVAATGHTAAEAVQENYVAPTCGARGRYNSVVYCSVCGEKLSQRTVTVSATGEHSYGEWYTTIEATCCQKEKQERVCSVCGAKEAQELDYGSHNLVAIKTVAPTCKEIGYTVYECSYCRNLCTMDLLPVTAHTDSDNDKICDVCGESTNSELEPNGHNYVDFVVEPTCTQEGYTRHFCAICGDEYIDSYVAANGHSMRVKTITPTCTENGCDIHICSVCGYNYFDDEVPATGHIAAAAVRENIVAATLTSKGSYDDVVYCSVCDTELSRTTMTTEIENPTASAKINIVASKTVDYKSKVIITATAENVPEGYHLELVYNGMFGAEGTNKEVTYPAGKITGNVSYTVQVVDNKGYVQQDANGNDLKETGTITCNANFFAKIIAFFKGLFGLLPTVTIKP